MASARFGLLCRQCRLSSAPPLLFSRPFTTGQVLLKPKANAKKQISKKAAAAKARKKTLKALQNIDHSEKLTLSDAINVLRAVEVTNPDATYELVIKCLMERGMTVPRGRINLPREAKPKSEETILVFAEGRQADEARKAGAHIVGGLELVDGILNHLHRASIFLSTPALIRPISPKLGRFLGPLGLMPSERRGTVTDDIAGYIRRLQGTSEWRGDKDGTVRISIAKMDFPIEDVEKNVQAFVDSVKRATGNAKDYEMQRGGSKKDVKPVMKITRIILSSTHGPGVELSGL